MFSINERNVLFPVTSYLKTINIVSGKADVSPSLKPFLNKSRAITPAPLTEIADTGLVLIAQGKIHWNLSSGKGEEAQKYLVTYIQPSRQKANINMVSLSHMGETCTMGSYISTCDWDVTAVPSLAKPTFNKEKLCNDHVVLISLSITQWPPNVAWVH